MSSMQPFSDEPHGPIGRTVGRVGSKEPGYYPAVPYYVEAGVRGGTGEADSFSLAQYVRILSRRKGTLFAFALLGALTAFLLSQTQPPVYRARALIEIENLNQDFLNTRSVNPTTPSEPSQSPEYTIRTQTMVLQSRPVLERAIAKMDIEKRLIGSRSGPGTFRWPKAQPAAERAALPSREQALTMAADELRVRVQPNTRLIEVTFDSHDPKLGADLVNSIAAGFAEQSREARRQSSQETSKWLSEQVADVKTKLELDEDALQRYAGKSNLTFLSEKDTVASERLRQLQLDLLKAQSDRVAKQSAYELGAAAQIESLPEVLDDSTLKDYQVQLTTLQRQMAELSSTYTAENPKVVNVQAQIATVEAALQGKRSNILSRIQNEYEAASRRESLLEAEYTSQVALLSHQATNIAHYSVLQREVDTTRQLYDSMMQRVKEASLASAMQASEIQVIESATPPRIPFKPDLLLNATFGLFSGIFLGVGLIIQRARSARGFQAPGDIAVQLNVPELGMIPSSMDVSMVRRLLSGPSLRLLFAGEPTGLELTPWKQWCSSIAASFRLTLASLLQSTKIRRLLGRSSLDGRSADDPTRLELTTWQQWHSAIAESYRLTLTSLLLSSEKNGEQPRVIVVSSALPGEGKTTVISNLGIALARMNCRVLLIDGDLRKPRLHEVFDVSNRVGFSDVLADDSSMPICPTKIPNLFLLASGEGVDERFFFTAPLKDLFRRLKEEFEMILIDTPPLLRMSDARLLSHHADAVILVVAQHTSREAVLLATQQLAEDGSRLVGTILNNWNPKTHSQGYRQYGDYEKRYVKDERSGASVH